MRKLAVVLILLFIAGINTSFNRSVKLPAAAKPSAPAVANGLLLKDSADFPTNYFISPLDLPLTLAGNFGEPRRLHFHTGLDFRTNQEEGHKVFAAADGYISRINVSGAGYGNALYITHPNGLVTVYGHLQQFNTTITERLRKEQYAKESFTVDFKVNPGELPVKQGEQIALSGNTGGSGGPHLHFEIRDSLENTYNPMLFGFKLKDDLKPVVSSLRFYAADSIKNRSSAFTKAIGGKNGIYEVEDVIKFNALQIGFAVNVHDIMNNTGAHVGIYNLTVFDGNRMVYDFKMQGFSFPEKRCVLSHIDYPAFLNEGRKSYHKCFVEPGNQAPLYDNLVDGGIIDLSDGKPHKLLVEISDFNGNVDLVKFTAQYDKAATTFKPQAFSYTQLLEYKDRNEFSTADIKLVWPIGCLFDDVYMSYSASLATDASIYSKVHQVGNSNQQAYDWFEVAVRTTVPEALHDKALLIYEDGSGDRAARGGRYQDGFIVAKGRDFGKYFVKVDTTGPTIRPLNISEGRKMTTYKTIVFKISDNLSGIADFDTYLDGKWVVTDYDAKSAMITHKIATDLQPGEHTFTVVAEDERKNRSTYDVKFQW